MSKINEILGPARMIMSGLGSVPKTGGSQSGSLDAVGDGRSVRTYYRRHDGLVTQRRSRVWSFVVGRSNQWEHMLLVDTCRAHTTKEAVRIFKSRPTPEGASPLAEG